MIHLNSWQRVIRIAQCSSFRKAIGLLNRIICRNVAIQTTMLLFLVVGPAFSSGPCILFRENFDSLAQWEPLTFPKVPDRIIASSYT